MDQHIDIGKENLEPRYESYKNYGNKVYQEYEDLYKKMWTKLNANHLEPFAKVLLEQENIVLKNQDEIIESMRQNLEQQMHEALDKSWHVYNIAEALISLEICKEKFKEYEGHKWDMDTKTPLERTRPIRMRYKEARLRYLQTQLAFQNKQLEETLQENVVLRHRIQNVKQERTNLMETIANVRKNLKLAKENITELQLKLIAESDENLEPAIDAENESILQQ